MINRERLVQTFLDLVQIDNPSGHEEEVARYCRGRLEALGLPIQTDKMGNIIARRAGVVPGETIMINAHMDSVQPCIGIKPVIDADGQTIRSDGSTILGADDRAGVAAILEAMQVIVEQSLPHPPLEVVLTVQEETGLTGSKGLDYALVTATSALVLDHTGKARSIVVGAPFQDGIKVKVHGKMAHAGVEPEKGMSAIRIAAEAIAAMPLGRIDSETTANIGIIKGGVATNIVAGLVEIDAEARSRDEAKLNAQVAAMRGAFEEAAQRLGGQVEFTAFRKYPGFKAVDSKLLRKLQTILQGMGQTPVLEETGGGSDTNIFRSRGIDALAFGMGAYGAHTLQEHLNVPEMVEATELIVRALTT